MSTTHGWSELAMVEKRDLISAIRLGTATSGPAHAELNLTDRCNVDCYFCNQREVRTKQEMPMPAVTSLLEQLADSGLRSVRLSGGGDPLMHSQIDLILDLLSKRGLVIDNLTTNGVLLTTSRAAALVNGGLTREILISLNAVDALDYKRMMRVKGAIFDNVIKNVESLVHARNGNQMPKVTVQFLLDKYNFSRMSDMCALGVRLGVDQVKINFVHESHGNGSHGRGLFNIDDFDLVAPDIRFALSNPQFCGKITFCSPFASWNRRLKELQRASSGPNRSALQDATSFREANGGCFFAWYSLTVKGNGDIYPCCMLMEPDYVPLGNWTNDGLSLAEHWTGNKFARLRAEMRDVLVSGSQIPFTKNKFHHLREQCTTSGLCDLKNEYFRGDEPFYSELGDMLADVRRSERPLDICG